MTAGRLERALNKSIRAADLDESELIVAEIARSLAKSIDQNPERTWRFGPQLLKLLVYLGMAPSARRGISPHAAQPPDGIEAIRARRDQELRAIGPREGA